MGRVSGLFGVKGWMKVFSYTKPREAILDYDRWHLNTDGAWRTVTVAEGKRHGAEGVLNTDWGDRGHRQFLAVSLMAFAFGAAESWNPGKADPKAFPRRFALHGFGDRTGKLAAALKTLGAWPGAELYHGLIERFDPNARPARLHFYPVIDKPALTDAALGGRIDQTKALRFPKLKVDDFEATALAEFDIARRMDELACRRVLIGRRLRAGKSVPSRDLRRLADDSLALADDFAAVWRVRNRPSRLRDNLKAIRSAAAEAAKLAR